MTSLIHQGDDTADNQGGWSRHLMPNSRPGSSPSPCEMFGMDRVFEFLTSGSHGIGLQCRMSVSSNSITIQLMASRKCTTWFGHGSSYTDALALTDGFQQQRFARREAVQINWSQSAAS